MSFSYQQIQLTIDFDNNGIKFMKLTNCATEQRKNPIKPFSYCPSGCILIKQFNHMKSVGPCG